MFKHASSNLKFYMDEEKQALNMPSPPQRLQAYSRMYVGGKHLLATSMDITSGGAIFNSNLNSNAQSFSPSPKMGATNRSFKISEAEILVDNTSRKGGDIGERQGTSSALQSTFTYTQQNEANFQF